MDVILFGGIFAREKIFSNEEKIEIDQI